MSSPSRRTVLRGAAGALLVPLTGALGGCSGDGDSGPTTPPPVHPDVALRVAAVALVNGLVAACAGLAAADPARTAAADALRSAHEAHLAALQAAVPSDPATDRTSPAPSPSPVVPTAGMTVAGLVALERAAATAHATGARTASPQLAQLLASISAAEATHELVLA